MIMITSVTVRSLEPWPWHEGNDKLAEAVDGE